MVVYKVYKKLIHTSLQICSIISSYVHFYLESPVLSVTVTFISGDPITTVISSSGCALLKLIIFLGCVV